MFQKKSLPRPTPPAASIAAAAPPGSDAPSIVGANLTFRGDIVGGGGDVRVEGKVFGRIDVDRLVIAKGGAVEGEVVAKTVEIAGSFIGSIRAGTVTLSATSKVQGDGLDDLLGIEIGASRKASSTGLPKSSATNRCRRRLSRRPRRGRSRWTCCGPGHWPSRRQRPAVRCR